MDNEILPVLGLADNRTIAACFTANILPVMTAEGEILDLGSSNSIVLLLFVLLEPKLVSNVICRVGVTNACLCKFARS